MYRYRVSLSGSAVQGPGLMTFYSASLENGLPAAVQTFLFNNAASFPTSLTFTFPNGGDQINEATGALTGVWSVASAPNSVSGTGTGNFALGVGMQVRWRTGGIVAGRRVVGSTFLVPTVSTNFAPDGSVSDAVISAMAPRISTLISAVPSLCVWSRPKGNRTGTSQIITSGYVPDRPSWLRSRRA